MDLKQHIKNLIIAYRDQFEELNQKEKKESGFSKFESPLQAELIWIENPNLKTHKSRLNIAPLCLKEKVYIKL